MPLYTYTCGTCETAQEHRVRYDDRDDTRLCPCGGQMQRRGLETFTIGQPAYQMAGITSDGTKVPGHFGRDAKRDKTKRKKR